MNDIIATELKQIIYEAVRDALKEQRPTLEPHKCIELPRVDTPVSESLEDLPPIMSAPRLGQAIEIDPKTLERWRKSWPNGACTGPRFVKAPGTKLYRYYRRDVLAWLDQGLAS